MLAPLRGEVEQKLRPRLAAAMGTVKREKPRSAHYHSAWVARWPALRYFHAVPRMNRHACYARSGDVLYRFKSRPARDAWVDDAPSGEKRRAIPASEVPFRLKTGRSVPGLELREGPELPPEPLKKR